MSTIIVILIMLVVTGFFAGMEIAFISSNKLKIELKRKQGSLLSNLLSKFTKSPSLFLGTTLVGINIALTVYGIFITDILKPYLDINLPTAINTPFVSLLIQTIISTTIILVCSEFLPKVLFRLNPNAILEFLILPFVLIYYLLYPIVTFFVTVSKFLLKVIFKISTEEEEQVFTRHDLETLLKQNTNDVNANNEIDKKMFENALYLRNVKIRECMVPRTELEAIEIGEGMEVLKQTFIRSKFSKLIIYKDTIDTIVGYVHNQKLIDGTSNHIENLLMPIPVVPETMVAADVMNLFIKNKQSIAWVVDEYGGTAGIVTLEDLLEEIFGEIDDEHDYEDLLDKQIDASTYLLSARHSIETLNQKYSLNIPVGDYETLAGYILSIHEEMPKTKESLQIHNYVIDILRATKTKIETVRLHCIDKNSSDLLN